MNALRRGVRNAFRNVTRSVGVVVILAVAIALSISMLVARDAVNSKIASVRASTGTDITVSPAGFFGFTGNGTALSEKKVNALVDLENVTAVQESLSQELSSSDTSLSAPSFSGSLGQRFGNFGGGASSNGSTTSRQFTFTPTVRVIGTNSPGTAVVGGANGGGTEKLTSGTSFSATSDADVALVGTSLATKNDLKVGDTFTAWKTKITVVGIYSAGSSFANADVLMPIATVQRLADAANQVTAATVVVNNISNVPSVTTAVKKALGSKADVTSQVATVSSELAPLNSVKTISTYTLIGALVAAVIILLLSMLMIVRERRREIGVLKAIGASNRSIVSQFIAESTTFTVLGSIVGFLGGVLLSSPITSALVSATGNSTTSNLPGGFVRGNGGPGAFAGGGTGFTRPAGAAGHFGNGTFHFGGVTNTLTTLHTSVGWSTFVFAFIIAIVIAALGSSVATANVVRVRPAEVLRSE